MKDLYYILGTDRNCTSSELNAAYQKLATKLQPDEKDHDHFLEDHFQEITEAYQTLSDPDKRRKYDVAFKKNYQRRLYYFKIKHLNVATTFALLLFTGLFGWYVMKMINSDKSKKNGKVIIDAKTAVTAPKTVLHHKKKPSGKVSPLLGQASVLTKDTTISREINPVTTTENKNAIRQDTLDKADIKHSAYLQSNATGMIYLHEQASYNSAVLSKIPDHSKVTILEKGTEFYKVAFDNQTGYVPKWTVANQ